LPFPYFNNRRSKYPLIYICPPQSATFARPIRTGMDFYASCAMQNLWNGGEMKVLIIMLGRSVWGLVNSSWASMREFGYVPDRVHIIAAKSNREDAKKASASLKVVLHEFSSPAETLIELVEGGDIESVSTTIKELLERYRKSGDRIALDVTSGTKDLVLGSLMNDLTGVEHVFYLRIDSLRNADRPYILIPVESQRMFDVIPEGRP